MSTEWRFSTLGEFVRLQRGHDLTSAEQEPGSVPIMGSAGPNGSHSKALAKGPGVVIGRSGASAGRVHFSEVDYWPHNTCLYVTDFLGNHPRFAYYLLQTIDLASFNSGSAQPSLNRNFLYAIPLKIPARNIQNEIVEVLETLDDRITLLRETNTTLEAIAQALFKSWFVDFDPVHAKMQGRAPEGMLDATAAQFPDSFEESELGAVPKGWSTGKLADIASLKGGKMLDKTSFSDSGANPVFGGAGVMGFSDLSNSEGFVITVGRVGAYCGQYFWHQGRAWVNNNASLVSPINPDDSCWLFLWLKNVDMDLIKKGAAQPFVSNGDISDLKIVLPPSLVVEKFVQLVEPIFQKLSLIREKTQSLEVLRDTLLPRLISGQILISDVQIDAKAA